MPSGRLVRAFAGGRTVRLLVVEAHGPARQTRVAHGLGSGSSRLAAEGLVASALLSAHIKGDERVTLQVQASEPRFALMSEIDASGQVRVRFTPSDAHSADGRIHGMMLVIKADAHQEVYRGVTEIEGKTLEEALSEHLGASAQVDAVLRIGAGVDEQGEILFAGGFLLERLPEDPRYPSISLEDFRKVYERLREADLRDVLTGIAFGKLLDSEVEVLESREIVWRCRCSAEKVEAMLGSLGSAELREMKADGGAEVTCHFCNGVYRVSPARLDELASMYLDN